MKQYKGFDEGLGLEGKVAVVTGGASGIGNAAAKMLKRRGAEVVLFDLSEEVKVIGEELGMLGMALNITDVEQVQAAVDNVMAEKGRIDILCNIAGMGSGTPAVEITKKEFDSVVGVNLMGAFYTAQIVGREMIKARNGGRIINMASQAGVVALYGHVAYSASKAGLLAVTRDLALEWGKHGITCNAISPTVVMTPMARDYWVGERGDAHLAQIPAGRFAEMDEVAMAVVYLASDAAAMVNGANLVIDGGFTIC